MKKNLLLLTTSEVFFLIAESSIVIFGMIFFYTKFDSILLAASPFILRHLLHAFLLPFFGKLLFKIGFKLSLVIGSLFYIAAALLILVNGENYTFEMLCVWSLLYALGNVFHYVPVIYIWGKLTQHKSRGRIFSLRRMVFILATIVTPIMGGLVSQNFGFHGLLLLYITFHLLTNIPIAYLGKIETKPPKSIIRTLMTMRGKKIFLYNTSAVFSISLNEFWPIYVFTILAVSYADLGILFALVNLISILLTYFMGKQLDKRDRANLYNLGSITNLFSWIFRAFSFNYITVLVSDVAFKLNSEFRGSINEVMAYDLMNDNVNDARGSIIILGEVVVNYLIAFVFFTGALSITVFGFQSTFILFAVIGFTLTQLMRRFLKSK